MLSKHTRTRLLRRDGKRVRAHRWLMEQALERKLEPYEQVHHRNGNPLDNELANLEVLLPGPHMRLHKQIYPDQKTCVACGQQYICNPRRRKRQKCCSPTCAQAMRVRAALQARGVA